ncbi:MAG: endonuclease/exonuclease/phosphatase family protein [Oscillospiraceae bacterium]|nr:endonuclease/exonuclease/phosphatase family protein [Oscillospiraceae bacterium]
MRKVLKALLALLLVIVLIVGGYFAYLFISFHRLGDNVTLEVENNQTGKTVAGKEQTYRVVSWNIGFGAYESDYGFFMDGGTESRAWSKERLDQNLKTIGEVLGQQDADFYIIQEVDRDSTRSYHVDESIYMKDALPGMSNVWALNYDSPYLMYPFSSPHGKSVAGLMTFTDYEITSALRRELPIENGLTKFLDLDRCYSVCRMNVPNGKELVLYNMHLSAYTSDGTIANEQLALLVADMKSEYEKGNYVVCGGDFNKDILGDSSVYFGKSDIEYTWAQPLPEGIFDGTGLQLVKPLNEDHPVPSCRNADGPYHQGQYVLTIDGFIVSDNVEVVSADVIDQQFAYSDHNPVEMTFILQ